MLALLTPEERTVAVSLLGYPEGSIGRLMTPDYVRVRAEWTVEQALDHIRRHGSAHTEGIVGEDADAIERFCSRVDAAAVIVNGSLRLHDGPTIGLGAELAISTGRVHVRGPVTIDALVTYSWRIEGNGAVRFLH